MDRKNRQLSESNIYHVVVRGVGRQLIFEDDKDRQEYMQMLLSDARKRNGLILAWCLMGNHVHLLLQLDMEQIAQVMRRVGSGYARYFNKRHDRVGHLFQGRFGSTPISTDEQLMAVVRYIHRNPDEGGVSTYESYPWSSYREYLGQAVTVDTKLVLGTFGSIEQFKMFHRSWNPERIESGSSTTALRDEDLLAFASTLSASVGDSRCGMRIGNVIPNLHKVFLRQIIDQIMPDILINRHAADIIDHFIRRRILQIQKRLLPF